MMRLHTASLALLIGFTALEPANFAFAQAPGTQKKSPESKQKGTTQATLTGCVDQQEGHYVLIDDSSLQPIADLEAEGFPTEGFAKHLGQKVTLRGTINSGSSRQSFKVRSVETISETCAPVSQPAKK